MKNKIISIIKVLALSVALVGVLSVSADTWPKPTLTTNTPKPINEGNDAQAKLGSLVIGSTSTTYPSTANTKLQVIGSSIINAFVSTGGTNIIGNLITQNLKISGITAPTTPKSLCVDKSGAVIICPGDVRVYDFTAIVDPSAPKGITDSMDVVYTWTVKNATQCTGSLGLTADIGSIQTPVYENVANNSYYASHLRSPANDYTWYGLKDATNGTHTKTVKDFSPTGVGAYAITCTDGTYFAQARANITTLREYLRDTPGTYTFSTSQIPAGVTSYKIEIWGGGGAGNTDSPYGCQGGDNGESDTSCGTLTTVVGGGVNMVANGGGSGKISASVYETSPGIASGGTINVNGTAGGLYSTSTTKYDGTHYYCIGGNGGNAGGLNSRGGTGGTGGTFSSGPYQLWGQNGGNYGAGGGGTGRLLDNTNTSCSLYLDMLVSNGGSSGGYSSRTLSVPSTPVTYTINVGRGGVGSSSATGGNGGKGAVLITW